MKEVIRRGLFETNSSSVHSITMCDDDTYTKWKNGELLYSDWDEKFITEEELNSAMKEANIDITDDNEVSEYISDHNIYDYDDYWDNIGDNIEYETYNDIYKTKSGEIIHAFGYYGHD